MDTRAKHGDMDKLKRLTFAHRLISEYRYSPAVLPVLWKRVRTGTFPNTRQVNRAIWGSWNWSTEGDEWSNAEIPGWKESIIEKLLVPFVDNGCTVLEIGPGAGRWTEHLVERAGKLVLVDVTPECIELCQEKFASRTNIEFHVNEGNNLGFIESSTVDRIWSFDVFVHILSVDIDRYVAEFARILSPGGRALVHHSKSGFSSGPWRSDMTGERMRQMAGSYGLDVIDQFESWGDGNQRFWPSLPPADNPDVVSIIRKPA